MNLIEITEKLKESSGLDIRVEHGCVAGGISVSELENATRFSVDGIDATFVMEGCGKAERAAAALCRELIARIKAERADEDPVRAYLNGRGKPVSDVDGDYYVVAVRCDANTPSVREYLFAIASTGDIAADMTDGVTAFCKRASADDGYVSAGEFARVLYENIAEEITPSIKIGIGGEACGGSVPEYYSRAARALEMGEKYDPSGVLYSYIDYAFVKAVAELPATVRREYTETVLGENAAEILADAELMTAADMFIKFSLNVSEASRNMYVHRNTLVYRLDKIERLTGLDLRNFNDAMAFRIACIISKA